MYTDKAVRVNREGRARWGRGGVGRQWILNLDHLSDAGNLAVTGPDESL